MKPIVRVRKKIVIRGRRRQPWLPHLFKPTNKGSWIKPDGRYYANRAIGYDRETLRAAGLAIPPEEKDLWEGLKHYAWASGWIRIGYYQSRFTDNTGVPHLEKKGVESYLIRRLTITLTAETAQNTKARRRILAVGRFYSELFDGNISYVIRIIDIETAKDENDKVTKVFSFRKSAELFSVKFLDSYLKEVR